MVTMMIMIMILMMTLIILKKWIFIFPISIYSQMKMNVRIKNTTVT